MPEVNWDDDVFEDALSAGAAIVLWTAFSGTLIAIGIFIGYFVWG